METPMSRRIILFVALLFAACYSATPAGNGSGVGEAGSGGSGGNGGPGGCGGTGGPGGGGGSGGPGGGGGVCGDAHVDPGEECDDGNAANDDCCDTACRIVGCGDGHRGCAEECDDGNRDAQDGCSPTCRRECVGDRDCDADRGETCVRDASQGAYGDCVVEGNWCEDDAECPALAPERCPSRESCYCRAAPAGGDGRHGVCREIAPWLAACSTDEECGTSWEVFARPAGCVAMICSSPEPSRLCLPFDSPQQACPLGYLSGRSDDPRGDLGGYCVPLYGCSIRPCAADSDCHDPDLPVCDQARGICGPGCYVDAEGQTVGCSATKPACHEIPERIAPNLLNDCTTAPLYGYGKCGLECQADTDCEHRGTDVNGDPFVCRDHGGKLACRPKGCVDDRECPPAYGAYPGFCDPTTQACAYDRCRLGSDPRAGCGVEEPYRDCAAGYLCVPDSSGGDTGACRPNEL
jgi:cysteine-rich repeat protein